MKVLLANLEDVFREASARWTLIAYFTLTTIFILLFASAINLDIVNGAVAGAKVFGQDLQMGRHSSQFQIDSLVVGFESIFSGVLFVVSLFLGIFATSHLVPRLQERGTIDLYLARPIPRVWLLLSRYLAGLSLAGINVFYLVFATWGLVIWKTHVVHFRFLWSGVIMLFAIASLLALSFLVGVITSSTAVSIMTAIATFFISFLLTFHKQFEAAMSHVWSAKAINVSYWVMPKLIELLQDAAYLVSGGELDRMGGPRFGNPIEPMTFVSTGIFLVSCLTLAALLFRRKEF